VQRATIRQPVGMFVDGEEKRKKVRTKSAEDGS
jgi:hypothetical protein